MWDSINELVYVCAMLCNFSPHLFVNYIIRVLHILYYKIHEVGHNGYCHYTQQLNNSRCFECSLLQSSSDDTGIKNPPFSLGTGGGWYGNLRANTFPTLESVITRMSFFRPTAISRSSISPPHSLVVNTCYCFACQSWSDNEHSS